MALRIEDINWEIELPKLPRSVQLMELETPKFEERRKAIDLFADLLKLGELKRVDLADSVVYASKRGEVEFYPASGGLWARDAIAEERYDNEMRDWPDLKREKTKDDIVLVLSPEISDKLIEQGRELLKSGGLVSEFSQPKGVVLEQVTQLNAEGKKMNQGAGTATVQFQYEINDLPVMGAGAKSHFYADPSREGIQHVGAFHCWRPVSGSGDLEIDIGSMEEAMAAGLLQDPELMLYHEKRGKIIVNALNFGYLALPAMLSQRYLFPVFQVEGQVHISDRQEEYFEFARYHHVVSAEKYQKAGIFAEYLMKMN